MSFARDDTASRSRENILEWNLRLDALDYYEILGVEPSASATELLDAYHRFALTFHPDTRPDDSLEIRQALTRIFQRGVEAYRVLSNSTLRNEYEELHSHGKRRYFDSFRAPKLELPVALPTLHERCRSAGAKLEAQQAARAWFRNDLAQTEQRLLNALRYDGDTNADVEQCLNAVRAIRERTD